METDAFISVSEGLKDSIEKISGIKNKVVVIPNMVSNDFNIDRNTKEKKGYIFTYIGAARKVKQIDKLLEAFKLFTDTSSNNCILRIIGDGPYLNKVKKYALKNGISEKIHFYGNIQKEKVARLLNSTDFFITASCLETFCVPIVEVWCSGVSVIMSDKMPLVTYADETNSVVFEDSNVKAISEAIETAINRYAFYDRKKISETDQSSFGYDVVVDMLMLLYKNLLGRCDK